MERRYYDIIDSSPLSLVFVSQGTSICCTRSDNLATTLVQGQERIAKSGGKRF